ncbi:hypothetical protein ADUPG1_004843, partial [Aduncisulcus paluster]
MGTLGFLTIEQCNKVDTEIKKKICKVIRYPFQAFPCSYLYSSRNDGGMGIISLLQTIDISRASALLEALSDPILQHPFLEDFLPLTLHSWEENILSFTMTGNGDIRRHSSPARIRSMNLNWLGPIM